MAWSKSIGLKVFKMLKMKAEYHFQGKFNIDVKIKNKKGESQLPRTKVRGL